MISLHLALDKFPIICAPFLANLLRARIQLFDSCGGVDFGDTVVLTRVYRDGQVINRGLALKPKKKRVSHVHFTNKETIPYRKLISVVDPVTSDQTVREDAIFINCRHSWCKVFVTTSYELVQCRRSQLETLNLSSPEHQKLLGFPRPRTQAQVDNTVKHMQRWLGTKVRECEKACNLCDIMCILL